MREINSQEYWEQRFAENWNASNGSRYTYFHGEVLLRNLPEWLIGEISRECLSICDWGCAEGESVNIFSGRFPNCEVTGVDFADSAIKAASRKFPEGKFRCEDWTSDEEGAETYDLVYSSHTLEHFRSPFEIMEKCLIKRAKKYLVILVPFAENPDKMDPEHYFRFIPEVIPQKIGNWPCVFYKVINSLNDNDYWKGVQTLLIFANPQYDTQLRTLASFSGDSGWMRDEVKSKSAMCVQLRRDLETEQEKRRLQTEHSKVILMQNDKLNAAVASQKEMLAAKDSKIRELQLSASEKDGRIALLEERAADTDEKNALLAERAADGETKIIALEESVAERDARVKTLEKSIAERDARVQTLEKSVAERDARVKTLEKSVAEGDARVKTLEKSVSERDARVKTLEKSVSERDARVKTLEESVAARDAELKSLREKSASLSKQVGELQAENSICKASREELWQIQRTRSYVAVQKINRIRAKICHSFGIEYPRGNPQKLKCPERASLPGKVVSGNSGRKITDLRVGVIMDQFSCSSFKPECDLFTFRADNWEEVMSAKKADFLMVESAWNGNDGAWQYLVGTYGGSSRDTLFALLDYCKKAQIPTVFWNKEDPPHFDKFIEAASRFDYVFTTDENCIPLYRKQCGHERVFALPFAAQPRLHNPILSVKRDKNICFAGTYYATRFEDRRARMDVLFKASENLGLDIYDRQFGNTGKGYEDYLFPEHLRKFIRGRLEYEDMVKAYRRYKIFLNVNSVENSRTMFSRRVFELLACGTPTVTTPSEGIRYFFGDLVPEVTDPVAGHQLMKQLLDDPLRWRRLSAAGVRCVISRHTYAHRLESVCKTIGINMQERCVNKVAVILHNVGNVESVLAMLDNQKVRPTLVVALKCGRDVVRALKNNNWETVEAANADECVRIVQKNDTINAVALWNGADVYTSEYLADAMLALNNYGCDVSGMCAVLRSNRGGWTADGDFGKENFMVDSVFTDTLVFRPGASGFRAFAEAALNVQKLVKTDAAYARYAFEYGAAGCGLKTEQLKEIIL